MSKIGKINISIPEKVKVALAGNIINIEGPFGKKSICVRSLPEILGQINSTVFLNDLADELLECDNISVVEEKIEKVISKIACHGSVRSGRKLNSSEMSVLLRTMETTPFSNQCNHGRPTFIELKLKDIEKLFNRN